MQNWNHKDEWKKQGKDFVVQIVRWSYAENLREEVKSYYDRGENNWNVYAYIYPNHRFFKSLSKAENSWDDVCLSIPFHGGATFLEKNEKDGRITSIKVGCDYSHYGDEHYAHYKTKDDAFSVFNDAEELIKFLE